jgi:hypothetical protein
MTINTSEKTKERFKYLKLKVEFKEGESLSEDDFLIILMNKFEGKRDDKKSKEK